MDPRIIQLYDEYTHVPLSRGEFLKRLAVLAGSTTAASSLLQYLEADYARSLTMVQNANDLFVETISYEGINGTMEAYVAKTKSDIKLPAVVVIHENRGLNPHIKEVTHRVARAGFLAIAPNALAVLGGTPENEDDARQLFTQLDGEANLINFIRVFDYLKTREDFNGRVACVGFCWGGAMAGNLAVHVPELLAASCYYGRQPASENVSKINAALQLHYAELDARVNEGIDAFLEALDQNNKSYELYMYDGVHHAFHNDTSTSRYNKEAATLAWQRTIEFFEKHL
ncbi:MAG TPA: dienelactone hydrolase family protein [Saprospiraceae bacterium]|nr:dienelactone hydrolase family protein [Saprospiraceae bacterium]